MNSSIDTLDSAIKNLKIPVDPSDSIAYGDFEANFPDKTDRFPHDR